MLFLYNVFISLIVRVLPYVALFNKKIKLFVQGRKETFSILEKKLCTSSKRIWIHVASLGEFEQGLPIITALKHKYPNMQIVVTFFSPSGYEVKKHSTQADVIVYLPMDTPKQVQKFLSVVRPEMAIFIKYDFWINYLLELKKRNIPTYLVSGIFRQGQWFFKPYGGISRQALRAFTHFFVQDFASARLLHSIGFDNVTISGDTRFDRVSEILHRDNSLSFAKDFISNKRCVVFGSSWAEDEALYIPFLNASQDVKYIIAPHKVGALEVERIRKKITKKVILFSEIKSQNLSQYEVLIIDTIGLLTKIYSYADIAYVGGAMKTGLHNVLEPAVFGIPVIIGKKYDKFLEARELVKEKGVISVATLSEFENEMTSLLSDKNKRISTGNINRQYIEQKRGTTQIVVDAITKSSNNAQFR